jgi:hypothetical protein
MGNPFSTTSFEDQVQELKFNLGIEIKTQEGNLTKLKKKMEKEMEELKAQLTRSQGDLDADARRKAIHIDRLDRAKTKLSEVKSTLQSMQLEVETAMSTASLTNVATEASNVYTALGRQVRARAALGLRRRWALFFCVTGADTHCEETGHAAQYGHQRTGKQARGTDGIE